MESSLRLLLISAFFTLLFCSGVEAQTVLPRDIVTVSFCDLVGNAEAYDQKIVRVRAFYAANFEGASLSLPSCKSDTWIIFDPSYKTNTEKKTLERFEKMSDVSPIRTKNGGNNHPTRYFEMTVVGKFDGPRKSGWLIQDNHRLLIDGRYGDGYSYQLNVLAVESAGKPSKSGKR